MDWFSLWEIGIGNLCFLTHIYINICVYLQIDIYIYTYIYIYIHMFRADFPQQTKSGDATNQSCFYGKIYVSL